ncbi:hypothetical protein [Bremerella cremea]|uniref:hypothetical protein n=1 Tax=Bremerella cremea TaxID=1031537 RepID=UPI0011C04AD2|nr:hypothetical protein [Bremerella cremea]
MIVAFLVVTSWPGLVASGESPRAEESLTVQQPIPQQVVDKFALSDFYQKCILIDGFPVVASAQVNDAALQEAAHVVQAMLVKRGDILQRLVANKIRLAVIGVHQQTCDIPEHSDLTPVDYWNRRARGFGATKQRPCVSCAEENVLNLPGDPYYEENILIHEFAHAIHLVALADLDPQFQEKLEACYEAALKKETWKDTYAGSNVTEYWAEGVQCWFESNAENNAQHNHLNTREELKQHDPQLHALIQSVFVDTSYHYVRSDSAERTEAHLQDLDRTKLGKFQWSSAEPTK